ncbi:hypothetical protein HDV57DRAFT_515567 [Trichoderma longibrachiatum]
MASFANVLCGEVPSLRALTVSPNVLGSHTIPLTATFARYITVPPTGLYVHIMEVASAANGQFIFNYRRPKEELGSLAMDLRDAPGGLAAVGPISNAFATATSQEDFVRRLGRITLLERSADMEAYTSHIRSQ